MTQDILIKCLKADGRSVHAFIDAQGSRDWDLPRDGRPGQWKGPVDGVLRPHHNGLHLAKKDYLIDWITGHHFIAETTGETVEGMDCVIARTARLTEALPVNDDKLRIFTENWLSMVPDILEALAVYPKISQDARACTDAIRDAGLHDAHRALGGLQAFKFVRQNALRLGYDELHSIEYNQCTKAAKISLQSITGVFNMAQKRSSGIELAKVVSNKIAAGFDALHQNYHFMQDLCAEGYDHKDEVQAMQRFLAQQRLVCVSSGSTQDITGFYAAVRKKQNGQILPALGL